MGAELIFFSMNTLSGQDLLDIGFLPNSVLGEALRFGNCLLSEGRGRDEVLVKIRTRFGPHPHGRLSLRTEPLPVSMACTVNTKEEEDNLQLSLDRIQEISLVPVVKRVSLMPDNCPTGREWGSMPVGGALVTSHHILPSAHSADINCGMHLSFFETRDSVSTLMKIMKKSCLFGYGGAGEDNQTTHPVLTEEVWANPFLAGLDEIAQKYLGTQGDGNHFSSIGTLEISSSLLRDLGECGKTRLAEDLLPYDGKMVQTFVTHHGSRRLGAEVYRRGMQRAEKATRRVSDRIPKGGCWLDIRTDEGRDYQQALEYIGRWTEANHYVVHERFLRNAGAFKIGEISNHHNAVWFHQGEVYHGKGATPAWKIGGHAQIGIIPLNMGSEILLVKGLDNQQFLSFAPHGAGRNKSRTAIKRDFLNPDTGELDDAALRRTYEQSTKGIHVEWASGKIDISESPIGYKSAGKIKNEIGRFGLAEVISSISPQGCMMAGESAHSYRGKRLRRGGREKAPDQTNAMNIGSKAGM